MTNCFNIIILGVLCCASFCLAAEKEAIVRVDVADEYGKPVANADIQVLFRGYQIEQNTQALVKTNAAGALEARGWPKSEFMAYVKVFSEAPYYYQSQLQAGSGTEHEFDLKLIVRKKEKPIAMYAKELKLELPEQRKEIGFDMEKGDWVKPYGKGEVADFTLMGTKVYEDREHYEASVVMGFPSDQAGMQLDPFRNHEAVKMSEFKTSRTAPLDGYRHTMNFISRWHGEHRDKGSTTDATYLFRSRVQLDEEGKIVSCHYGKMIDAVNVSAKSNQPEGNPIVRFTYYFNPTPMDRNLEFDPKQNLFPSSDGNLQVVKP